MQSSFRSSGSVAVKAVPALLTLFVTLCTFVPLHVLGSGEMTPLFALVCVFYWSVYSPQALPYSFLFVLGLLQDALSGTPLGMSSFINLGLSYLLHSQRRLMGKAHFGAVWLSAGALLAMATMTEWSIMCLVSGKTYDVSVPLLRWTVTCTTYPLMHLLLTQLYKRIRRS